MEKLLWLIPAFPLTGAFVLLITRGNLHRTLAAVIGVGSMGLSAALALAFGVRYLYNPEWVITQHLWTWFNVGGLNPEFSLRLDALSMVFVFVITFVGFLIHLYSVEFMRDDEGFSRFFTYLNLFVCAMLVLVLADNLLLLYLGWEGVGLCSYLLIGFWYGDPKNGYAARKAFIITRVGDIAMAIGLFILVRTLGTLNIQEILTLAPQTWDAGSSMVTAISLLLLGGACGKSAQLPLQTWLPDAMAGPSPVSALIHAATMVTAGVYLITRMFTLFELAPTAQLWVGIIGALTLLIAGFSALTQNDLKRVLAYSTISQIGYMFLALGVGAWSSAIFHFMIHGFFKALLFLGAGAIIMVLHHEHDMFRIGGLRHKLPTLYWTFLVGAGSLAALPFITAGFYSKDQILWLAWAGDKGNGWFFFAALTGAFVTAVYTFRMVILTFFGEEKTPAGHSPGWLITAPLIVLAFFSLLGGFVETPHTLGHIALFSDFVGPVLPAIELKPGVETTEWIIQLSAGMLCLVGVYVAYFFYAKQPETRAELKRSMWVLNRFWYKGWGFDALYDTVLVKPFVYLARINRGDIVDKLYSGIVEATRFFHQLLAQTQSGVMRWYIMGIVIGAIFVLSIGLLMT